MMHNVQIPDFDVPLATETSLRFVGELSPFWGSVVACAGGVSAFLFYRRESFDLPGTLRWILPLLRSLAIWLAIMTLTGPILHHRKEVGELGKVRLLVDTSQSMDTADPQMPLARKLLSARNLGWLPKSRFSTEAFDIAQDLGELCNSIYEACHGETISQDEMRRITEGTYLGAASILEVIDDLNDGKSEQPGSVDVFRKEIVDRLSELSEEELTTDEDAQKRKTRSLLLLTN